MTKSVVVDDKVCKTIRSLFPLGPLHNPGNLMGIEVLKELLPKVTQTVTIDTAFHQTMPPEAFRYAVPTDWYKKDGVRRYGFHGTSHLYCSKRAAVLLGKEPKKTNVVICHIGNGASLSAVKNGVCVDTSMGLTPLEGLVMGTRSGDLDPAILPYIMNRRGMTAEEMDKALNKESGLLGLCGLVDRRDVSKAASEGNSDAALARAMEIRRIKKYIGSYMFLLGDVDAIVFTAGVGEFDAEVREKALEGLEKYGIILDKEKNALARSRDGEFEISDRKSKVKVFVIPTDEELVITEDAVALLDGTYKDHMKFKYSFSDPKWFNKSRKARLRAKLAEKPELKAAIAKKSWK